MCGVLVVVVEMTFNLSLFLHDVFYALLAFSMFVVYTMAISFFSDNVIYLSRLYALNCHITIVRYEPRTIKTLL